MIREMLIQDIHVDDAIQLLEEELVPHSELARLLDKSSNYHLSIKHHKLCVQIIESIMRLKSKEKVVYSYDFTQSILT